MVFDFDLAVYEPGFVLQFPPMTGGEVIRGPPDKVLSSVYKEYNSWGKILQVPCVGDVNKNVIGAKNAQAFVGLCEAVHNEKIVRAAMAINVRVKNGCQLVLIAGLLFLFLFSCSILKN
jgi:hypothetical protein